MTSARRRAEEALAEWDALCSRPDAVEYDQLVKAVVGMTKALRSLLAEEDERGAEAITPEVAAAMNAHSLAELPPAPPAADEVASGTPGTYKQGGNDGNDDTARKNGRQNGDRDTEDGEGSAVLGVQSADGALPDGTTRRRPDEVPILQGRAPDGTVAPAADEVREAAFARFGRALLPKWWDDGNPGDIDGGDAQDAAEAAGLWHPVERHADGVECESCGNEGPCGELTEAGLSALAARGGA